MYMCVRGIDFVSLWLGEGIMGRRLGGCLGQPLHFILAQASCLWLGVNDFNNSANHGT